MFAKILILFSHLKTFYKFFYKVYLLIIFYYKGNYYSYSTVARRAQEQLRLSINHGIWNFRPAFRQKKNNCIKESAKLIIPIPFLLFYPVIIFNRTRQW